MNELKTLQVLEGTYLYKGDPQTVLCPYNVADVDPGEMVEVINSKGEVCCTAKVVKITKKLFANITTAECHSVSHLGFSSWGSAYETQRQLDPEFSQLSPVSLVEVVPDTYIVPGITYSVVTPESEAIGEPAPVPEGIQTDAYMDSVVDSLSSKEAPIEE